MSFTSALLDGVVSFTNKLLPSFRKSRIPDNLNKIYKAMSTVVTIYNVEGRAYQTQLEREMGNLLREIERKCPTYRKNFTQYVYKTAVARLNERGEFSDYAYKAFGPIIAKSELNYRQTQLLQYIVGMAFFALYARKLMMYMNSRLIDDPSILSPTDRSDEVFLKNKDNQRNFAMILKALQFDMSYMSKTLVRLGEMHFDPDTHAYIKKDRRGQIDPLQVGMLPIIGDLAFFIGSGFNALISNSQQVDEAEAEKIKIQLMMLRRKKDGITKGAPEFDKLTKSIEYYSDRLSKLEMKADDISEGY